MPTNGVDRLRESTLDVNLTRLVRTAGWPSLVLRLLGHHEHTDHVTLEFVAHDLNESKALTTEWATAVLEHDTEAEGDVEGTNYLAPGILDGRSAGELRTFLCQLQRDCKRFLADRDREDRALRGGVHASYDSGHAPRDGSGGGKPDAPRMEQEQAERMVAMARDNGVSLPSEDSLLPGPRLLAHVAKVSSATVRPGEARARPRWAPVLSGHCYDTLADEGMGHKVLDRATATMLAKMRLRAYAVATSGVAAPVADKYALDPSGGGLLLSAAAVRMYAAAAAAVAAPQASDRSPPY